MLDKQTTLYLYRGASSSIDFDFSEFVFANGSKCEFTISSIYKDDILIGKIKISNINNIIKLFSQSIDKIQINI